MVRLMSSVIYVLDIGAGPDLVRKSELPPGMEALISFGPTQEIADASNRTLRTLEAIKMPGRLGRFVAVADFIVCEKLAVLLIPGAEYCNRFIESIYPGRKKVELANFSKVLISRCFSLEKRDKNLVPREDEKEARGERIFPKEKVARAAKVAPGTQQDVECISQRFVLAVVQSYSPLYGNMDY